MPGPRVAPRHKRRTVRANAYLRRLAFALSGEPGQRFARATGVPSSARTLLRLIRRTPVPAVEPVTALGVDDWAQCRGRKYGTLLVNLTTHRVIDLLPDRTAATLAAWLVRHPEIVVIFAGEHIDWRARIADAATGNQLSQAQIKQLGVTVTVLLQGGPTVKMVYEAHPPAQAHPKKQSYYWVGPWAVPATYPMGPLIWTIKVHDKLGDTATFAPIGQDVGIPSIIIAPKH